jgi:hypothetical protein
VRVLGLGEAHPLADESLELKSGREVKENVSQ